MSELRFKRNRMIKVFPVEDKLTGMVISEDETVNTLNHYNDENNKLKSLLQMCVNDMYSPSGKIKKATARKLMAACQKGIVNFPD